MDPKHFESLYPDQTRFNEIEKTLGIIKSGLSCQIVGLPGSGRSNLLGLLSYNKNIRLKHLGENQKWFHFVYMDFSEVKKRSFAEVIKFILISLAYSLSERNLKEEYNVVNKFLKEAVEYQDELISFQVLKKTIDYLAIEKELNVVFLFDRFDEYVQDLSEQFFLNLKILRNRAKYRFSCVFSVSRPLEEIIEASVISEFYEYLAENTTYLSLYDKVGIDFRFSYTEKISGRKKDEKTKNEIVNLTGGHGKLAKLSYEAVLAGEKEVLDLKKFLLNKPSIIKSLFEIWNSLTPFEQIYLKKIKEKKNKEDIPYLANSGLIKEDKISIPLFEEFIKDQDVQTKEKITYDLNKNLILKGQETLTEKLSPSEFRLLRYLIQNQEKICEKEEVINAVWKDSKTKEGVTDQALDQIIYRLRKKIEQDPNNPVYIQTIKGRGFKFNP